MILVAILLLVELILSLHCGNVEYVSGHPVAILLLVELILSLDR